MESEHVEKTIKFYAHDYRDMKMSRDGLDDMLHSFIEAIHCGHECSSNCRRDGCNCDCGEYHF